MQIHQLKAKVTSAAYSEMWLNPHDDKQVTIVPKRINKLVGDIANVNLEYINHRLPDTRNRYVVYELGRINGVTLGIEDDRFEMLYWESLDTFAKSNELLVNCHIKQRMLPLSSVYIKRTNKGTLLLAVDELINRALLRTKEPLYFRVFSNDWLNKVEDGQRIGNPIEVYSAYINQPADVLEVLNQWRDNAMYNRYLYHNGFLVNTFSVDEIKLYDTVMVIIDKTGLGYKDYNINDLPTFHSRLDGTTKHFLQLDFLNPDDVVPVDEVDIYICNDQADVGIYPRTKGIYYSRIFTGDLRQITHQDIAIDAQRVSAIIHEHRDDMTLTDPFFRVYFRRTAERKKQAPLVDGQYTLDLFLADAPLRRQLMLGAASTNVLWQAAALEQSPYVQWQQFEIDRYDPNMVNGVFSVEELSRRLRSPYFGRAEGLFKNDIEQTCYYALPPIVDMGVMVLCYDVNGLLIHREHVSGQGEGSQIPLPFATHRVRALPGSFVTSGEAFDRDTNYVDQADVYAEEFYYRTVEDERWNPAVLGDDYTIDKESGKIQWAGKHVDDGRMRRTVRDSIYQRYEVDPELLYYPLSIYSIAPPTPLRLSHTEVYLNGHYLTPGIDYRQDELTITILNKQYFLDTVTEGATLEVEIFHYGLPLDTHYWQETGFIKHRTFARDVDSHITLHRDASVWIDGKLAEEDGLNVFERTSRPMDEAYREGGIYTKTSGVMLLSEWAKMLFCLGDTGTRALAASRTLNNYLPKPDTSGPVFITHAHAIYSPFVYSVIQRLRSKTIDVETVGSTRSAVALALKPYTEERLADIVSQELDWAMINIHPAPTNEQLTITENEYEFLQMANDLYFANRLQFNAYFTIY